jgi:protein-S-isoprenylcysteine O-methyltransferase Ste14/uncharacterized membrane protein (UPF0127 family)
LGSEPQSEPVTRGLRDAATGMLLIPRLRVARTHWARMKGLLGTRALGSDEGLWITPSDQVHTIGMRYALDLVFVDRENRVVALEQRVTPGRISRKVAAAASVLELPAGAIERLALAEGARLAIEPGIDAARRMDLRAVGTALTNLSLAVFYGFFIAAHVTRLAEPAHRARIVPLIILETIIVVLFLTRRPVRLQSRRVLDWTLGVAGSYLPMLLRPRGPSGSLALLGEMLEITGVTVAVIALVFLGRSFGIVAANRGVKTGGAYGVVRHPMYAGYFLTYVGYAVSYPTLLNASLAIVTLATQIARALMEERVLSHDPAYQEYRRQTPWRFIPYVC